jgi:hypothetical protein
VPRPTTRPPLKTFEQNIADARLLLDLAEALSNRRRYAMRRELQDRVAGAFRVSGQDRRQLDLIESEHLWLVCKPGTTLTRQALTNLAPLLRAVVVTACAALETYVADTGCRHVGLALNANDISIKFRSIPGTVGDWMDVIGRYERPIWGVRAHVEAWMVQTASTAPNRIADVLGAIGLAKDWSKRLDQLRTVEPGTTIRQLDEITARRNRIAHSNDRVKGRSGILTVAEVGEVVRIIESVAQALDQLVSERVHRIEESGST